jgi:hypothetical protein
MKYRRRRLFDLLIENGKAHILNWHFGRTSISKWSGGDTSAQLSLKFSFEFKYSFLYSVHDILYLVSSNNFISNVLSL